MRFTGSYDGLAAWLLERAGVDVDRPAAGAPAGVDPQLADAVVVDSYTIEEAELCRLAETLPLATLAEARRCEGAGILLDYHLDRDGEPATSRLLPGPAYAPVDPRFAGAASPRDPVERILVTVGGSARGQAVVDDLVRGARSVFPDAAVVVPGGPPVPEGASPLPGPVALVDEVGAIDVAVTAAGFTSYELACAGVPQVAVAIADNQSRVVDGLRRAGVAPCVDLARGEPRTALLEALEELRDPDARRRYAARGMRAFDGRGADRAAEALTSRFLGPDSQG